MKRKNSIICKWFAFNRSHYSKARRKIHWMCVFFLTPTFIRRIIIQLAMHKQMLDGQMKKSREKKSNKPTMPLKGSAFNYHFLSLFHTIYYVLALFAPHTNSRSHSIAYPNNCDSQWQSKSNGFLMRVFVPREFIHKQWRENHLVWQIQATHTHTEKMRNFR